MNTIKIPNVGVTYTEPENNQVYLCLVKENNSEDSMTVSLTLTVASDDLSAAWATMAMGRIVYSISMKELLQRLKTTVDTQHPGR